MLQVSPCLIAAAEKPVYARFDRKKGKNIESHKKHNCEFDIGATDLTT